MNEQKIAQMPEYRKTMLAARRHIYNALRQQYPHEMIAFMYDPWYISAGVDPWFIGGCI